MPYTRDLDHLPPYGQIAASLCMIAEALVHIGQALETLRKDGKLDNEFEALAQGIRTPLSAAVESFQRAGCPGAPDKVKMVHRSRD